MPTIEMYSKMLCPYCHRAKRTLQLRGLDFNIIDITFKPGQRAEMIKRSSRTTVPQIFIGGYHVGGSDDLEIAKESGLLEKLIAGELPKHR